MDDYFGEGIDYLEDDEEEGYTGRPVPESTTRVGATHHPDCPNGEWDPAFECCSALWEADYHRKRNEEAEDLHAEWWQ